MITHSLRSISLLLVALMVTAALLGIAFSPALAQARTGVCPDNPSPVDPADPAIVVDEPSDGDEVTSPMAVSGQARVFEANVLIALFDADGNELVSTFTTAEGGAPEMGPFASEIEFTVSQSQPGCLRLSEEAAEDGTETNVVLIEVMLAAADEGTPAPPATGSGGLSTSGSGSTSTALLILSVATLLVSATGAAAASRTYQRDR